jgi:FKBP-type peptidyl-prolyl cis-trans isomerase
LKENGKVFDSTDTKGPFGLTVGLKQVTEGWDQGLIGMKVGGKRRLLIPAHLGYGGRGYADSIPPNADLEFDVELVRIK